MFVVTLNRKSGGKILGAVLAVCFLLAAACTVKRLVFDRRRTVAAVRPSYEMTTTQQMADYILSKGYTVDLQTARVKEVKIPRKFDAEFENFNDKIKQTDGLSLEKYKEHSDLFENDLYNEISLETCVSKRISEGGTSVTSVEKQVAYIRNELK